MSRENNIGVYDKDLSSAVHISTSWGTVMQKPLNMLNKNLNNKVLVELKSNREYRGILEGYDPHMNLVLKNAEELVNKELRRKLDLAIVRGDNVIYISP
jgi:small nuclear ribonucleoprotein